MGTWQNSEYAQKYFLKNTIESYGNRVKLANLDEDLSHHPAALKTDEIYNYRNLSKMCESICHRDYSFSEERCISGHHIKILHDDRFPFLKKKNRTSIVSCDLLISSDLDLEDLKVQITYLNYIKTPRGAVPAYFLAADNGFIYYSTNATLQNGDCSSIVVNAKNQPCTLVSSFTVSQNKGDIYKHEWCDTTIVRCPLLPGSDFSYQNRPKLTSFDDSTYDWFYGFEEFKNIRPPTQSPFVQEPSESTTIDYEFLKHIGGQLIVPIITILLSINLNMLIDAVKKKRYLPLLYCMFFFIIGISAMIIDWKFFGTRNLIPITISAAIGLSIILVYEAMQPNDIEMSDRLEISSIFSMIILFLTMSFLFEIPYVSALTRGMYDTVNDIIPVEKVRHRALSYAEDTFLRITNLSYSVLKHDNSFLQYLLSKTIHPKYTMVDEHGKETLIYPVIHEYFYNVYYDYLAMIVITFYLRMFSINSVASHFNASDKHSEGLLTQLNWFIFTNVPTHTVDVIQYAIIVVVAFCTLGLLPIIVSHLVTNILLIIPARQRVGKKKI